MTKNELLESYTNRVWDLLEDFQAFNIQSVPREKNKNAGRLVEIGAQYDVPKHIEEEKEQHIRVVVRASIPDNCENWKVLDSNEHIVSFLQSEAKFSKRNQSRL